MDISIGYYVSKEYLDNEFVQTGQRGQAYRFLLIKPEDLAPAQRKALLDYQSVCSNMGMSVFSNSISLHRFVLIPTDPSPFNVSRPRIAERPIYLDAEPSLDEVFERLAERITEYSEASRLMELELIRYEQLKAELATKQAAAHEKRHEEDLQRERAKKQERLARATIPWECDGKAVVNLHEAIFAASGLVRDSRFKSWVKEVTGIDTSKDTGYSILGGFVPDRTVEVECGKHIYLVAAQTGSRRYQTTEYVVVVMDANGTLSLTDIETDDTDAGWALRIRKDLQALLD